MSGVGFDVDGTLVENTSGTFLLSDIVSVADACKNGDWKAAGLYAGAGALDAVATASDPFGSLISAGLGWLMDHFEPLKGWLNDLTGDAEAVRGFAATWTGASTTLNTQSTHLERIALDDFSEMDGAGVTSYQSFAKGLSKDIKGLSESATAVSKSIEEAASLVSLVHSIVRDVIADLVGSAISWAGEIVFSLGTATGWVIEQVSTRVASLAATVGTKVKALIQSVTALKGLLTKLTGLLGKLKGLLHAKAPKGHVGRHRADGPPVTTPRHWGQWPRHAKTEWNHPTPRSVRDTVYGEGLINQGERAQEE